MRTVTYDRYGGADVLEVNNADKPGLPDDKLLVRVKASSVNPVDYKVRRGDMKIISGRKFPKTAGSDFAGVVEKAGQHVAGYREGDEVYGFVSPVKGGAYSEYLIADPMNVSLKPAEFSFEEAAAMPIAALTALQALNYLGDVKEGSSVLINGASGGVGSFAVQIAAALGAAVAGTCSEKNMDLCRNIGAENVFDHSGDELEKSGLKFDVFFDASARSSFPKAKKYLKKGGIYISTLPSAGLILSRMLNFIPGRKKAKLVMVKSSGIDLTILTGFAAANMIKPVIGHRFELEDIVRAHELAEKGGFRGKIVVKI